MEDAVYPEEKVRLKLDQTSAHQKRECSCTLGERDEKTGLLIPARDAKSKADKYITVLM